MRPQRQRGKDHPHIRGEYEAQQIFSEFIRGSSPHTWGVPADPGSFLDLIMDHPHIRGEY